MTDQKGLSIALRINTSKKIIKINIKYVNEDYAIIHNAHSNILENSPRK